ncbi:hypothetical protein FEP58_05284 [Burkholderia multivorans]|nr:hypothetical protein [Burkholderia multivorans]
MRGLIRNDGRIPDDRAMRAAGGDCRDGLLGRVLEIEVRVLLLDRDQLRGARVRRGDDLAAARRRSRVAARDAHVAGTQIALREQQRRVGRIGDRRAREAREHVAIAFEQPHELVRGDAVVVAAVDARGGERRDDAGRAERFARDGLVERSGRRAGKRAHAHRRGGGGQCRQRGAGCERAGRGEVGESDVHVRTLGWKSGSAPARGGAGAT